MPTPKKSLQSTLNATVNGGATYKTSAQSAQSDLLDTVMCSTYSNIVNTVSESGVVNIPITQPANTVIEDIIPICTADTSHDSATIGFKVGTAEGGAQVVAAVEDAILAPAGTAVTAGAGTSIHAKVQTTMGGGAPLIITPGAGYSATERTIYAQVSASAGGFDTDTGAFRVIAKYYNL